MGDQQMSWDHFFGFLISKIDTYWRKFWDRKVDDPENAAQFCPRFI